MKIFRKFFKKLGNLIRWLPVIWNDYQWDYDSVYTILQHKLKLMHEFHTYDTIVCREQADETCDEINICLLALDRLKNNDYLTEALKPFDELYPNFDFLINFETHIDEKGRSYDVWNDGMTKEQSALFRECGDNAEKAELNDIAVLFKTLQNCIRNWWD